MKRREKKRRRGRVRKEGEGIGEERMCQVGSGRPRCPSAEAEAE